MTTFQRFGSRTVRSTIQAGQEGQTALVRLTGGTMAEEAVAPEYHGTGLESNESLFALGQSNRTVRSQDDVSAAD